MNGLPAEQKRTIDIETLPDLRPGAREQYIEAARENVKIPTGATKETLAADLGITDKDEIKFTPRASLDARWIAQVGPTQAEPAGDAEWRQTSFSGLTGQLLMIGIAIEDEAPFVLPTGPAPAPVAVSYTAMRLNARAELGGQSRVRIVSLSCLAH